MRYLVPVALALLGFALSLVVHILGWLQMDPPFGGAVFLLHVGIFPLWIPLVMLSNRNMPKGAKGNAEHLLKELPRWLRTAISVLGIYVFINFGYFMYCTSKFPKHQVPTWVELRGFSGHWLLFYAAAAVGFWALGRLAAKRALSV